MSQQRKLKHLEIASDEDIKVIYDWVDALNNIGLCSDSDWRSIWHDLEEKRSYLVFCNTCEYELANCRCVDADAAYDAWKDRQIDESEE